MTKYNEFIFKGKAVTTEKTTAEDLRETAMDTGDSASGLDQWAPGDMKLLSQEAFETLAELLNMIEDGAERLEQLKLARAAFLSKKNRRKIEPIRVQGTSNVAGCL